MEKMTEKDWNEVDRTSREETELLLSCQLSADGIYESHGNCSWDISCMLKDKKVGIEIKDRNCDLSSFGDIMVTDYKYGCNMRRIRNGEFDRFLIISFYRDKKMAIVDLQDKDMRTEHKFCNYTTLVKGQSKEKVQKICYIFPQRIKLQKTPNGWRKI